MAEMYDHTIDTYKKDTLIYETHSKMGEFLHHGKKEDYGSISVSSNESYYEFIKEKTMFK